MATTDLHALYANRSLGKARAFLSNARQANASGGSTASGLLSRSPGSYSGGGGGGVVGHAVGVEVNRRDHLGRTVLHLVSNEVDDWAVDWLVLLVGVGSLQVNLQDTESGWGALHRALYVGNIAGARLLLSHPNIDPNLKDHEGLTPFDLYNSTVDGTNPSDHSNSTTNPGRLELFTWGANRNFVLGFEGDSDRTYPERVQLKREPVGLGVGEELVGLDKWEPLRVKDVALQRLHTGIVTDEARNNMRMCGYGTGGRLGDTKQTQFSFSPLKGFPYKVASVALSPDHTVVVTTAGDVWTFGLNRFAQLGYVVDSPVNVAPSSFAPGSSQNAKAGEDVQSVPRRVVGALKKEHVRGAAASRTHTVVFTDDALYTWGTSKGQLGYATSEQQILPRKVTSVSAPIVMVTATETATACLLESKEVVVLYKDGYHKLTFPLTPFPSQMQAYRPPQVSNRPNIAKITSCGNTFAALSSLGDVFTFQVGEGVDGAGGSGSAQGKVLLKPQRIWSLRRKFTAVTDVGVGLDGSIILSTVSGHVYVRTRKFEVVGGKASSSALSASTGGGGGGGWKFARVPYLQRCVRVAANSTGAFAALRADVPLRFIDIEGPTLAENLLAILPHWRRVGPLGAKSGSRQRHAEQADDDEELDPGIERDVEVTLRLVSVWAEWNASWEQPLAGSDVVVLAEGKPIPAHSVLLAARSPILAQRLAPSAVAAPIELGGSALSVLLLLHYIYSDDLPAVWDGRVTARLRELRPELDLNVGQVKHDLQQMAAELHLPHLAQSLEFHVKTSPTPTLALDLGALLHSASPAALPALPAPDIVVILADKEVPCHSVILRARCSFFEMFYDDDEWTRKRLESEGGVLRFDLSHWDYDVARLVLDHVYLDKGMSLFRSVDKPTADEYIDFVTLVLACANELLLDKLKLVCSAVLRSFVTLHNVGAILADAAFYEAPALGRACMYFIASSMETVLENRLLDDLPEELVAVVSRFCQERQGAKSPVARSGLLWNELMAKHATWVSDLDVGRPTGGAKKFKPTIPKSPRVVAALTPNGMSPAGSPLLQPRRLDSPNASPLARPVRDDDTMFAMDDDFDLDAGIKASLASAPVAGGLPTGLGFGRRTSSAGVPGLASSPSAKSYMALGSPPPSRLQPWGAQASGSTGDSSLATIMARESAAAAAMPQRTRPSLVPGSASGSPVASGSGSASWRPTTPGSFKASRASLLDIQNEQQATNRPPMQSTRPVAKHAPASAHAPPAPSAGASPSGSRPVAPGPVFTPGRLSAADRSASAARMSWTNYALSAGAGLPGSPPSSFVALASSPPPAPTPLPPVLRSTASAFTPGVPFVSAARPPTPPFVGSPSSPPVSSFASIQAAQAAELASIKERKAVRSFAEVMEAERLRELEDERVREEQVRIEAEAKEAVEFERWFEEESRRVRREEEMVRLALSGGSPNSGAGGARTGGGGRGGKGGGGGGGGRGGGRGGKKPVGEGGGQQVGSPTPSGRGKGKGKAASGAGGGGGARASPGPGRGKGQQAQGTPTKVHSA